MLCTGLRVPSITLKNKDPSTQATKLPLSPNTQSLTRQKNLQTTNENQEILRKSMDKILKETRWIHFTRVSLTKETSSFPARGDRRRFSWSSSNSANSQFVGVRDPETSSSANNQQDEK